MFCLTLDLHLQSFHQSTANLVVSYCVWGPTAVRVLARISGIWVCNCLTTESSFTLVPLSVVRSIIRNTFQDKSPTAMQEKFPAFHIPLLFFFRSRKSHHIQMR